MEDVDNDCNGTVEGDEVVPCLGDFNNNGHIEIGDLLIMLTNFGCTGGGCEADLNGDGSTNTADAIIFLTLFGNLCP
jgi:hypothetical protein